MHRVYQTAAAVRTGHLGYTGSMVARRIGVLATCVFCFLGALSAPLAQDEKLRAAVWEHRDGVTNLVGATRVLEQAGFEVLELPRDRSPRSLDADLVVLGSFLSEHPSYRRYMNKHAGDLLEWVRAGGVLLQLSQDHRVEPSPPFLPPGYSAERSGLHFKNLIVGDTAPALLEGLTVPVHDRLEFPLPGHPLKAASLHSFRGQQGFRVLLWSDTQIRYGLPALLEGAHGEGGILLASLYLDKLYDGAGESAVSESFEFASQAFFRNLAVHVARIRSGRAEPFAPSRYDPPPPASHPEGSWTLALLPDTQMYAADFPEIYDAQTAWIVDNRDRLDIRYVLHLGDITNANRPEQWRNARRSMKILDGRVPYTLATGNHDFIQPDGTLYMEKRKTLFHRHFPVKPYLQWPTFGGTFEAERVDNSFHLFSAGGRDWIVVSLEWLPRDRVVEWADEVLSEHSGRSAILVSHEYLEADDTRIRLPEQNGKRHPALVGMNDGEDLWRKLASRHRNVVFVLCGHVTGDGDGLATERGVHGNPVHQMMVNFQMRPEGGEGYLRLLEFPPGGETVQVRTYSPHLDRYMTWDGHQTVLELPPPPGRSSNGSSRPDHRHETLGVE